MASAVGKMLLGRTAKQSVTKYFNSEDLWYEKYEYTDRRGRTVMKRRKKTIDKRLSPKNQKLLKQAKRRAWLLDMYFYPCGIKFGISAIIGLIPGIGDAIDAYLAWRIIKLCEEASLKQNVRNQMYANLSFDFLIGLVPILGDIADGVYKCNTRNVALLERALMKELEAPAPGGSTSNRPQGVVGRTQADYGNGHGTQQPLGEPPGYDLQEELRRPEATASRDEPRAKWGWFGRRQQGDLEAGPQQPPRLA